MGVESYFVDVKLKKILNIEDIQKILIRNGFNVSKHVIKYGWIFPIKQQSERDIIIDNIILCSVERDNISFEACFSCYDKSVAKIITILAQFKKENLIQYLYFGREKFDIQDKNIEDLNKLLDIFTFKRRKIFYDNYTKQEIEILPHDFYPYYRKNRKKLK